MEAYQDETEETNEQKTSEMKLTYNQILILVCLIGFFIVLALIITSQRGKR